VNIYTYYLTQRPFGPGTFPKDGLVEGFNYECKEFIPQIGMKAWASVSYSRQLSEKEVMDYELVPESYSIQISRAQIDALRRALCVACDSIDNQEDIDQLCEVHEQLLKLINAD